MSRLLRLDTGSRKNVLPTPHHPDAGILALECVWHRDCRDAVRLIPLEHGAATGQMSFERNVEFARQRYDSVFAALCVANEQSRVSKVDILDTQADALHESETGAIPGTSPSGRASTAL